MCVRVMYYFCDSLYSCEWVIPLVMGSPSFKEAFNKLNDGKFSNINDCALIIYQADEDILSESFRLQGWECTVATSFEKLLSFPFHTLRQFDVILVTNEFNRKSVLCSLLCCLGVHFSPFYAIFQMCCGRPRGNARLTWKSLLQLQFSAHPFRGVSSEQHSGWGGVDETMPLDSRAALCGQRDRHHSAWERQVRSEEAILLSRIFSIDACSENR